MLAREIKQYIQEPILAEAGWDTEADRLIIYGTGYVESAYQAIMQKGTPKNGGVGFYQDEPTDYNDLLIWLKNGFNRPMLERVLSACNYTELPTNIMAVAHNIAYATLICRMHYHRVRESLPKDITNARAYAEYHLKYYNGNGEGKADVEKNTIVFQRIINGEI